MKTLPSTLTLILLTACITIAQEKPYAYGQPSDLKGLKKVYIDTGPDTKNRDSIIKDLEKSKLGLEIVDEEKDAEIFLGFGAGKVANKIWTSSMGARVLEQRTGSGVVFVHIRDKDRLILSFQDTQNTKWERSPVTNFVREFIKAYKKGNNLK